MVMSLTTNTVTNPTLKFTVFNGFCQFFLSSYLLHNFCCIFFESLWSCTPSTELRVESSR